MSQNYPDHTIYMIIPVYNEGERVHKLIDRMPFDSIDKLIIVDDGSTDGALDTVASDTVTVLRNDNRRNIGYTIAKGLTYGAEQGADILMVMAGNGKDSPEQAPRLIDAIVHDGADYVQGSRYLDGGAYGKMPRHRVVATRLYPFLVRVLLRREVTDSTNGYRAFRSSVINHPEIDITQDWLFANMEYYLYIKVLQLGLNFTEVPVSKIYPQNVGYRQYTKVRPFIDWLHVLSPLLYLVILRSRK